MAKPARAKTGTMTGTGSAAKHMRIGTGEAPEGALFPALGIPACWLACLHVYLLEWPVPCAGITEGNVSITGTRRGAQTGIETGTTEKAIAIGSGRGRRATASDTQTAETGPGVTGDRPCACDWLGATCSLLG